MNASVESLLAKAEDYASKGITQEAFHCATRALLSWPGDQEILAFIARLNYKPKANPPQPPAAPVVKTFPLPSFFTTTVEEWPQSYFGGHPQRYEHNYAKYIE